ncbi:transposase family protein [bacterium]|jgi:transposase InsO family protein|nr:transposase family protein [bacterium]MBT7914293.1 transposase family protein [Candidatus Bathyarchaeota archaeon]
MKNEENLSRSETWAAFRLSVIGHLLASPPQRGELQTAILELSEREWEHPVTKKAVHIGFSTIEGWYYEARKLGANPIKVLAQKRRKDTGRFSTMSAAIKEALISLHGQHTRWSHRLHYDNLLVMAQADMSLGSVPSYNTVRRFRKQHGFEKPLRIKHPRKTDKKQEGEEKSRFFDREVRSFESPYVNGLWHCDFHHCSRKLLHPSGEWRRPKLAAVLDDHSRLVCHLQWYWDETAQNLIHAFMQAFLKCGLPRTLMSDNGAAMTASETSAGLRRLGIIHETTLPYSPYQNGKQEVLFAQVEGRLMAMLENVEVVDLSFLNTTTQAWLEMEYQQKVHSKIECAPKHRFMNAKNVSRESPGMQELEKLFTVQETRRLRKSDGTIQLVGKRFEIPRRFHHLENIHVRYASWNLADVWISDPQEGTILARLFPVDLEKNAEGIRRTIKPLEKGSSLSTSDQQKPGKEKKMAPLLEKLIEDFAATGRPPAFLPKDEDWDKGDKS